MNLYLVKTADASADLWVAHETAGGDLYVYVQNTGKFHRNVALEDDYYVDHEYVYEPITAATAREIVAVGTVGKLDGRTKSAQVHRYENDAEALDVSLILGIKRTRSEAEIRAARVKALRNAKPGVPVTWKTYPLGQIHNARVAVTDIRAGKISALKEFKNLDAKTEKVNGEVLVMIFRVEETQLERGHAAATAAATSKKAPVR